MLCMIHFPFLSWFSRVFSLSVFVNICFSPSLSHLAPSLLWFTWKTSTFGFLTLATSLLPQTGMADVSSNNSDVTDFLAGRLTASLTLTEVIWINTSWLSASHVRRPSNLVCFFSDHVAVTIRNSLPAAPSSSHDQKRYLPHLCPLHDHCASCQQ